MINKSQCRTSGRPAETVLKSLGKRQWGFFLYKKRRVICVHLNTENIIVSQTRGSFPKNCYLNKMNVAFGERKMSQFGHSQVDTGLFESAETVFL